MSCDRRQPLAIHPHNRPMLCHRCMLASAARPCSQNSARPAGFKTGRIVSSAVAQQGVGTGSCESLWSLIVPIGTAERIQTPAQRMLLTPDLHRCSLVALSVESFGGGLYNGCRSWIRDRRPLPAVAG
jgi:hypothetical protein